MKHKFKEHITLLTKHIERHNILMIIVSSIVSLVALFFAIFWEFDPNTYGYEIDQVYLIGDITFLVISVLLTGLLVLSRFYKKILSVLVVAIHIYVLGLIAWGTTYCLFDLMNGYSPSFYFLIFTIVAGLFIVEPLFFVVLIVTSLTVVLSISLKEHAIFFTGPEKIENILTLVIYILVIILVAIEHFGITIKDYRIEKELEFLTYNDGLTGLLNERSYIKESEDIDHLIKENKISEFAIILMDVNNIKVTNDTYGHRYGCHLIVRCGHTLPNYFKESKLFHIGGDEFVVIVYGEDYKNLDNIVKEFDNNLTYSRITFEGVDLIFSIAYGVASYKDGMKYRDVLQIADKAMYENKKMIKEKYGLKQR